MSRILIVEDNADLAFGLRASLEAEGHTVMVAEDGHLGLARVRDWQPQLVILDLSLPHVDGYTVLQTVRAEGNNVPVLILTARGAETDIVRGFHLGADDHVTKPFGLSVLLARVRALLRRGTSDAPKAEEERVLRFGEIEVDPATRRVSRAGQPVQLTYKEFDLLMALLGRRGVVATRQQLLREVWEHQADVQTRTVDIHVAELRRKLEPDPANPRHILTVWKVGYRLET
jgi:two-component system response regulator MtrA